MTRAKRIHLLDRDASTPVTANQLPFSQQLLCDSQAALLSYYQTVLAQTKYQVLLAGLQQQHSGAPAILRPTTLPLPTVNQPPKASTPSSAAKAAMAAAGLLALSSADEEKAAKQMPTLPPAK